MLAKKSVSSTIVRETLSDGLVSAGHGCNATGVRAYVTPTQVRDTFRACASATDESRPAINTPKRSPTR